MTVDFSFIHCADLHLGSRFKGVTEADTGLGSRMCATPLESFSRLVDAALERDASFIVISGDVYDDACTLPTTRMAFADEMRRAGVPVFISRGNHDHRQSWDDAIPYPPNVMEFGTEPSRTSPLPGVEVVGVSFQGDLESRNLVSMLSGTRGLFTVACVHCDVDPSGDRYYAPCSMSDFVGKDVEYWALGHIHARRILREDPHVVYPGNIQGRNPKEDGDKGAYLVHVRGGRVSDMEFLKLHSVAWRDVHVDISSASVDLVAEKVVSVTSPGDMVRLTITGSGPLERIIRSDAGQFAQLISMRTGCRIISVNMKQGAKVAEGDHLALSVVAATEQLRNGGRQAVLELLSENKMFQTRMSYFDSLSDEELSDLVSDARDRFLHHMGVRL